MTSDDSGVLPADVLSERRHLMSLAFRMLGTVAEAEDAVQETYIRWYRLSQADRDAIASRLMRYRGDRRKWAGCP